MPRRKQVVAQLPDAGFGSAAAPSLPARIDSLLEAASQRLLELHQETGNAVFAEMRSGQADFLNRLRSILSAWPLPRLLWVQQQLWVSVAAWLELTLQAQAALVQRLCETAAERAAGPSGATGAARRPDMVERRMRAVVIKFPDRRAA